MPFAWFICSFDRADRNNLPRRVCAMDRFTPQVARWAESETLGNRALVKVEATNAVLNTIAGTAGFRRLPLAALDNSLSSLTAGQRNAIRDEILDAGYTLAELNARFPNLASATLGDVLRFMATRRIAHRYDANLDTFVFDGDVATPEPIDKVDAMVR